MAVPPRHGARLTEYPSAPIVPAGEPYPTGRFRFGWLFAAVWLVYLSAPLSQVLDRPRGWPRMLGLTALAVFATSYVVFTKLAQNARFGRGPARRPVWWWGQVLVLVALTGLLVPLAGSAALVGLVYVAALSMMSLPLTWAWAVSGVLVVVLETLMHLVPGWRDDGYGLGMLLAILATWGVRLMFDRNHGLVSAQAEVGRRAVENERTRIAADLHDILGHSLTVITLKAELAQRLLDVDLERARAELRDLEVLSRDALHDVRATALGVRGVSLPGEIAAAREALTAAGVAAVLPTVADEVPTRWRELFAWTVREGVTNLVRHSRASSCEVRLTPDSVEILDDGVGDLGGSEGSGLAGLRRRADALQARLVVGNRADAPGFRVRLEVPT